MKHFFLWVHISRLGATARFVYDNFLPLIIPIWWPRELWWVARCLSLTSKAQWLLYVPPGLTLTGSAFCPHSVFMCFVWISEQTSIIYLYSINWLVFITETECVYCAVLTGSLYIIQVQFLLKRLMQNPEIRSSKSNDQDHILGFVCE
jgi:hypothetical protein